MNAEKSELETLIWACTNVLRWIVGLGMIAFGMLLLGSKLAPPLLDGLARLQNPFELIFWGFELVFSGYVLIFIVWVGFWLLPGSESFWGLGKRNKRLGRQSKPTWLAWVAFGWIVFLFFFLPSISMSRIHPPPAGTFLWLKVATTIISSVSCVILLWIPRKWWKVAMIPVVGILLLLQIEPWIHLP